MYECSNKICDPNALKKTPICEMKFYFILFSSIHSFNAKNVIFFPSILSMEECKKRDFILLFIFFPSILSMEECKKRDLFFLSIHSFNVGRHKIKICENVQDKLSKCLEQHDYPQLT